MTTRNEEIVSSAGSSIPGPLHTLVLIAAGEVSLVGEGEGAWLQLLVELSPTESVLLINADCVVEIVELTCVSCNQTDHNYNHATRGIFFCKVDTE